MVSGTGQPVGLSEMVTGAAQIAGQSLRLMRLLKKTGMLADMSKKTIKVGDEIITIVCRLPEPPDDDRRKP